MALTPSTMVPTGSRMPDFKLLEPSTGKIFDSAVLKNNPVLIAFICNHCPYVRHISEKFADFSREYIAKGLRIVAINSNDIQAYPDDSPEQMVKETIRRGYEFPYLFDETQSTAKNFRAACTPDLFLYNNIGMLVYRGQFDASRPGNNIPVTGQFLRQAVDSLLSGHPVTVEQIPSMGCNIKWKKGNEPD